MIKVAVEQHAHRLGLIPDVLSVTEIYAWNIRRTKSRESIKARFLFWKTKIRVSFRRASVVNVVVLCVLICMMYQLCAVSKCVKTRRFTIIVGRFEGRSTFTPTIRILTSKHFKNYKTGYCYWQKGSKDGSRKLARCLNSKLYLKVATKIVVLNENGSYYGNGFQHNPPEDLMVSGLSSCTERVVSRRKE